MRELLFYHHGYDRLMVAFPIYERAHWYKFHNDPYGYEGTTAHKRDLLEELGWELIDSWMLPTGTDLK